MPCSTGAGTCCSPSPRSWAISAGDPDLGWRLTTLAIAAGAAVWMYVLYTRRPEPNKDHLLRLDVFFVGLLVFASVLMLRQPLFFIFMIAGFFYATVLRPLPLAVVGVAATSILVNTLIAGFPQTSDAWTWYLAIITVQTIAISAGAVFGEKVTEQNEERRVALARLEAALVENAGLHAQLLTQAREAGRPRRAAADGARDPRHDRPGLDRDHHPARGGRPHEGSAGRPRSPHRDRQAPRPREPDRGSALGRGVDARRARGRDAPGRARRRGARVVRAQRLPGRGRRSPAR